jgi:hypothetical protein
MVHEKRRKHQYMFDTQMEMSFEAANGRLSPRQRRLTRSQWWFQRMRQIVDRAIDWQPVPEPRPQQMWFPGSHRQPQTTTPQTAIKSHSDTHERQICE